MCFPVVSRALGPTPRRVLRDLPTTQAVATSTEPSGTLYQPKIFKELVKYLGNNSTHRKRVKLEIIKSQNSCVTISDTDCKSFVFCDSSKNFPLFYIVKNSSEASMVSNHDPSRAKRRGSVRSSYG